MKHEEHARNREIVFCSNHFISQCLSKYWNVIPGRQLAFVVLPLDKRHKKIV